MWGWRTKPRSIIKTIQWFKYFAALENKNWDFTSNELSRNGKKIHPVRREYYYNVQKEEDISSPIYGLSFSEYVSGSKDTKADTESNARNDLATYKFFGLGYVDGIGRIKVTKVGNLVVNQRFDGEALLKQLLKMSFPSLSTGYGKNITKGKKIFPMQIIIKLLLDLEYISRYELAYVFFCTDFSDYKTLKRCIQKFRKKYLELERKNKAKECFAIFKSTAEEFFHFSQANSLDTLFTMGDAICRSLEFTGLFSVSGRGNFSKLRVANYARKKIELLHTKYNYSSKETSNFDEYMQWFGDTDVIILPWDNQKERKDLIRDKIQLLNEIVTNFNNQYALNINVEKESLYSKLNHIVSSTELKLFEEDLILQITSINEDIFVRYTSKSEMVRNEIVEKFNDILSGNEDKAALWLECNTWKSLVALSGDKEVKRNFKLEEDLTPKSFAPGKNNTADMEVYTEENILIPEVSLMSGVQQWEHEGSSVIDHVLKHINRSNKKVYGVFISKSIHIRTNWQFFILNKQSWMGKPVPVIPFTIEQYNDILEFMYKRDMDICSFIELVKLIHEEALKSDNFMTWNDKFHKLIESWKNKYDV